MDTIGKECLVEEKLLYQYKSSVGIPPLGMADDLVSISTCGLQTVLLNAFLNAKTSIKKLQFGVNKCHHIHIGKNKIKCPDLFINEWKLKKIDELETGFDNLDDILGDDALMAKVEYDKYLGDIIAADGTNDRNIKARKDKANGIIRQIMSMLNDYSFGPYYFQVAIILRNLMLINATLCNSEVWYNLTESNLTQLESVDETLLRKILETGTSTLKVMLYLDLGVIPIRFIIMNRRVMYLSYILRNKKTLLYKFFLAQLKNPCKGDWTITVIEDLKQLGITETFEEIARISEERFRNIVKEKIKILAFRYLITIKDKEKERSKVNKVQFHELEMQSYLLPNKMSTNTMDSTQLCKFVFSLRTRMVQVRDNFKSSYADTNCQLCYQHVDSQPNLLNCKMLQDDALVAATPEYEDLFSNDAEKQLKIAILLREKFRKRKQLLKTKPA